MPAASFDAVSAKATLNQYWYSKKSIQAMIGEVQHHAAACAFLSTPSLFFALDERRGDEDEHEERRLTELRANSKVFEYDRQWEKDPAFVFYDFQKPEQVPIQYMGHFDYVVADPPFITEEVWQAYIATVKLLLRPGGKVLFTTVLENHAMLETLMNGPLFIPIFRPLVRHLTYQYVCFLNYEPTVLSRIINDEIEPEDPKVRAAIEMANSIRQSEEAFAQQMQQRQRDGEAALPRGAYETEQRIAAQHHRETAAIGDEAGRNLYEVKDWNAVALEDMPWGHIPEGLSMYATAAGGTSSNAVTNNEASCSTLDTPAYTQAMDVRQHLASFKGEVDLMQKLLNQQLMMKSKVLKVKKGLKELREAGEEAKSAELETELKGLEEEAAEVQHHREEKLQRMEKLIDQVEAGEEVLGHLIQVEGNEPSSTSAYITGMRECVEKYANVAINKAALLELASSATGRYKAPVFNRMQALLREMKEMKRRAAA